MSSNPKLIKALYPNFIPYLIGCGVVLLGFLIGVPALGLSYFDVRVLPILASLPAIFVFPFAAAMPAIRGGTVRIFEDGIWLYHYQEFYAFADVKRILYRPHERMKTEGRVLLLLKDPLNYDIYDARYKLRPLSPAQRAKKARLDPNRLGPEFKHFEASWSSNEALIGLLERLTGLKAEEHDRPFYREN